MSVPALHPICFFCKHYIDGFDSGIGEPNCKAFPEGIPPEISEEGWDHREPLGDEKILFEVRSGEEENLKRWEEARQIGQETDLEIAMLDEGIE